MITQLDVMTIISRTQVKNKDFMEKTKKNEEYSELADDQKEYLQNIWIITTHSSSSHSSNLSGRDISLSNSFESNTSLNS